MARLPVSTRTLAHQRPWLLVALTGAVAWYFLSDNEIGGLYLILLKGVGAAALAVYCWRRLSGTDGLLIGTVMALSALGDMAIELDFRAGGAAFFAAHVTAIALYLRHRRPALSNSQRTAGAALLLLTPGVSYFLTLDWAVTLYGLALGGMAAAAWWSAFPRYRVGLGAVLFVISDLLIFARMGPLGWEEIGDLLIWPTYFAGQFLIATGVVQTMRARGSA
ncbi:lysoplasmalogenase family protein [Erythrobacteraceae bacterium WH01K]|nr:lysoplasmalogenase family protein [Erythrobacteraceae bacterium WH01K]